VSTPVVIPGIVPPRSVVDTTADAGWVPVRVAAVLAEPLVAWDTNPLHLDGPASWGAYLDHVTEHGHHVLPPMGRGQCVDLPLPMATWTRPAPGQVDELALGADESQVWGWACSAARPLGDVGHTKVQVRRRPAVEAGHRYAPDNRWHLSTGPLKARDVTHPAALILGLEWWALADPDRLARVLGRVTHLGRLARHGHGRVLRWDVDPDDSAADRWQNRTFPDPAGLPGAIRAPYHHHSRRMPCTAPPR
jgi:hypothetical protein